jgi:tellurite resistance protein TerA
VNLRWSNPDDCAAAECADCAAGWTPARPRAWPQGPKVDLDLGCLYQFTDGQRGVVQAAGARHGDFARPPYVRLDRDDRTGSSTGENLFINMDHSAHFQRLLIFVLLAGGADDLTKLGAVLTLYPTSGPALELRLDGSPPPPPPQELRRRHDPAHRHRVHAQDRGKFFPGYQSEIDKAYAWGLHWAPGPRQGAHLVPGPPVQSRVRVAGPREPRRGRGQGVDRCRYTGGCFGRLAQR